MSLGLNFSIVRFSALSSVIRDPISEELEILCLSWVRFELGCDRSNPAFADSGNGPFQIFGFSILILGTLCAEAFKTNTTNSASRSTYPQFANTKIVICLVSKILVILDFALFVLCFQGALSSRCVNNEEILDTIPFKKENSVSDQKGKNVSFLSSSENTVQKTLVADNRIAINKGQAFFQKNRNGVVERYMQGRPRPSASRVTVQGPKKLGAPKLLGWYIYICFYKSINL
ncbi:uncharacterized protein LOC126622805 [Malus sylvestris]|uniref:uncharacterized protein LOC126622805 n=1 Tax=Malus sylvestris TaxID=3752 RepID=UPI0021ABEBD8|nr:uncharacterized protein LOC126622805 [Malus sylvestris]